MEHAAPTRMNLLARRAQIKLAQDGAALLKGKREALLKELIAQARVLRRLREELHERGRAAAAAVAMARAVRGTPEVQSAAAAGRRELDVTVRFEKVWGLNLAQTEQCGIVREIMARGFGYIDCPIHVAEAAQAAEEMLEQLVRCAPLERNLQLLGEEVRKTSRRINALEENLLPRLRSDVRSISRVLEEREREDMFRLKRIKRKKAQRKNESR